MSELCCPTCDANRAVPDGATIWVRCSSCSAMLFLPGAGPRVLIGHESETVSGQVGAVLHEAGFSPLHAATGTKVLSLLGKHRPAALVLDVGIGEVLSFQIVEHLRHTPELTATKIVLLASVYSHTAYKRRPRSLYGADDYVEQHHIPDYLPTKLAHLLDFTPPADHREALMERRRSILSGAGRCDLEGRERVRALARSIVADIALYHQHELEEAIGEGNFERLEPALAEGRRVLRAAIDGQPSADGDPIGEALAALIDEMRQARR